MRTICACLLGWFMGDLLYMLSIKPNEIMFYLILIPVTIIFVFAYEKYKQ